MELGEERTGCIQEIKISYGECANATVTFRYTTATRTITKECIDALFSPKHSQLVLGREQNNYVHF